VTEPRPIEPFAPGSVSLRLYPHNDLPAGEVVEELRRQARAAESAGFDGVMVSEHHGGFAGYLPNPIQTAGAQTASNMGTAITGSYLNNYNQVTPTKSVFEGGRGALGCYVGAAQKAERQRQSQILLAFPAQEIGRKLEGAGVPADGVAQGRGRDQQRHDGGAGRAREHGRPTNDIGLMNVAVTMNVRPCIQQCANDIDVATSCGEMQRSRVVAYVTCVRICVVLQHQLDYVTMPPRRRGMQ